MHFFSVPSTIQWLIPSCTWRKVGQEKMIYLTFDDGPHPEITAWVMDELKKHQIKATFFCVGDNLRKHTATAKQLLTEGHQIGNHTMHHIKGWKHKNVDYLRDIEDCDTEICKIYEQLNDKKAQPRLFRPPYGQIKPSQIKLLRTKGYEIIQWSDLSCDYDKRLDCERSLSALVKNVKSGSIVVFHDSEKAENQLKQILPRYLEAMLAEGYTFQTL
jgi:peptidoglycan/xylan/chitin deacetylase (PgdA/CDA1 family)